MEFEFRETKQLDSKDVYKLYGDARWSVYTGDMDNFELRFEC